MHFNEITLEDICMIEALGPAFGWSADHLSWLLFVPVC